MHPPEAVPAMSTSDSKERMRVQLENKDLKKLSLGTKVRVTTEGVVTELRAPEKYETCGPCDGDEKKERIIPPCMYIEVDSTKVAPIGSKQIDEIVASDEAVEAEYD